MATVVDNAMAAAAQSELVKKTLIPIPLALIELYDTHMSAHLKPVEQWWATVSEWGDVRVRDWPLMNPIDMLVVVFGYLMIVATLTFVMKRRSTPLPTRYIAIIHNIHLTALSLYMLIDVLRHAYASNFKLFGNGVDTSTTGPAYGLARALWIFYVSKVAEFFDTILMAAKRNFHQITFLHVYHHASIFMIWWAIVYFAPGGEAYFSAALNSFIHVLMYGYYLWSTFSSSKKEVASADGKKPRVTPCQPGYWRPYITRMQLTQFCCMLFQASYDLLVPNPYPRFAIWILFIYMFTMLGLFGNFYVQAYLKAGRSRAEKAKKTA